MAKLQDLHDHIGKDDKAVLKLRLVKDDSENAEETVAVVEVFQGITAGVYCRIFYDEKSGHPIPPYPRYTWEELLSKDAGIEVTSDEWVIMPKDSPMFW